MNTAERVLHHLKLHPNLVFCDECLARALRVRGSLTRMLDVFSAAYFRRGIAECHVCGETKMSIERIRQVISERRKPRISD